MLFVIVSLLMTVVISSLLSQQPIAYGQDSLGATAVFDEDTSWQDVLKRCAGFFRCIHDRTTGWNNNQSMLLATQDDRKVWSAIYPEKPLDVIPGNKYELVTHMKLNQWVVGSHIILEGFNETSKQWYQLIQCPGGTKGPMEWREFSCIITVPKDTTKVRPALNAGWSAKTNNYAVSWFDSISIFPSDSGLKPSASTTPPSPLPKSTGQIPEDVTGASKKTAGENACRMVGFVICADNGSG
jgi:hypothetical protein